MKANFITIKSKGKIYATTKAAVKHNKIRKKRLLKYSDFKNFNIYKTLFVKDYILFWFLNA